MTHPLGEEHDAAVQWAADLARSLDTRDKTALEAAWNGPHGLQHRATLKKTPGGIALLEQLVVYVRERMKALDQVPA